MRELCGSEYLPQNIVHWHTDYFKLKEFKKWQVHEGLSDLFSPEAGHKILMWKVFSLHVEERSILSLKTKGPKKNPKE